MRTSILQVLTTPRLRRSRVPRVSLGLGLALAASLGARGASATTIMEVGDNGSEQMGRGGAWVARASDPLAAFYNPAGLAGQDTRFTLQANVNIQNTCFTRLKANNDGTKEDGAGGTQAPGTSFPKVCSDGKPFPNPQIAFTYRLSPRVGLGFAILGPSASGQSNWPDPNTSQSTVAPQRYLLVNANTLLLTPTLGVGWEPIDRLRVGASFIWGVASLDFTNYSWGANVNGSTPVANDVRGELKVVDVFIPGFTLGTIWSPTDQIDIAGWYKFISPIDAKGSVNTQVGTGSHAAYSDSTMSNCGLATQPQGTCKQNDAEAKINIPMEAKLGFRYHVPRQGVDVAHHRDPMSQDVFDIEADLTWANDSAFDQISLQFPGSLGAGNNAGNGVIPVNGGNNAVIGYLPPNASVPHNFKDVYGVRLGGDYNVLPDQLAIRAGAYFETAAQDSQYQNIDFAGTQRVGVAAGGTYRIHLGSTPKTNAIELSLGVGHTFIATTTNETQTGVLGLAGTPCNQSIPANGANPQGTGAICANGTPKYRTEWPVNLGTITNAFTSINLGLSYRF